MIETKPIETKSLGQVWDEWLLERGVHPQLFAMHRKYGITEGRTCWQCEADCEIPVIDPKWQACGLCAEGEREDDEADD